MFRLVLLGTVDLRAESGRTDDAVLAQPRRTALLAYLALARPRGFQRRDALRTRFWPEMEPERGRAALRSAVHFLRQSLGDGVVVGRGQEEVELAGEAFECDVFDFERALAAGRLEEALALYGGPLMPEFHFGESGEWERWLHSERTRLARLATGAATRLAGMAEAEGNPVAELRWRRAAVEMDPDDEVALRALLLALDAAGDRAGALAAYDAFATRVSAVFDAEPASETVALLRAIRNRRAAAPAPVEHPVSMESAAAPEPSTAGVASPVPAHRSRSRRKWRWLAAASMVAGACVAAVAWSRVSADAGADNAYVDRRVAVLPFAVLTGPAQAYLGDGMTDLVSARLDGTGEFTTVDPYAMLAFLRAGGDSATGPDTGRAVARRFGAGRYVLGSIFQAGQRIHIQAALYDQEGRRRSRAEVTEVVEDSLFGAVDALVRQLVASEMDRPAEQIGRTAALTTTSLPALKAYLAGESDFRRGAFHPAAEHFGRATRIDSAFALAWYRLSVARTWAGEDGSVAAARALRLSAQLAPTDQKLLRARLAFQAGSALEAEALCRELIASRPDLIEAWNELGEIRFHRAIWGGRSLEGARGAWERVVELDRDNVNARIHLAHIAALAGREAELDRMVNEVARLSPAHESLTRLKLLRAFALRDTAARTAMLDTLRLRTASPRDARDDPAWGAAWRTADFLGDPAAGLRISRLMVAPGRSARGRLVGHATRAQLQMARGRWRDARAEIDSAAAIDAEYAARCWAYLVALSPVPVPRAELDRALAALAATSPPRPDGVGDVVDHEKSSFPVARHHYLLGALAVRLGDTARAADALAALGTVRDPAPGAARFALHLRHQLRARVLAARGDAAGALAQVEKGWPAPVPDVFVKDDSYSTVAERFFRAELLAARGRDAEALLWFGSLTEDISRGLVFPTAAHLAQGRILERRDRAAAAAHYARYVEIWGAADAEIQPRVRFARSRALHLR
ncbi:MAG TPA: BTAD domain-containing putative transcriptional regulator [Longimicrobium sp.]|nr:BTAD domain-containing putative transcriptional regulator [Longimicrobium sp.]